MTQQLKEWESKIRKDFQDFADSIVWSNDVGDEKYIGVGNMADWWVERFHQELLSLLQRKSEEIEGLRKNVCICHSGGGYAVCCEECKNADCLGRRGFNQAINDCIAHLKSLVTLKR